jgi:hypothetical protein
MPTTYYLDLRILLPHSVDIIDPPLAPVLEASVALQQVSAQLEGLQEALCQVWPLTVAVEHFPATIPFHNPIPLAVKTP